MADHQLSDEQRLHACVDGELDKAARQRLLLEMDGNPDMRASLCGLRNTKDWVQFAFEGETAPTRSIPRIAFGLGHTRLLGLAASVALLALAFGAGWFGQQARQAVTQQWVLHSSAARPHDVLLHIGVEDRRRYDALLDRADRLMQEYRDRDVQVEVVATGGRQGLLRSDTSSFAGRVSEMIENYDHVRFFACLNGLKRLRAQGVDPLWIDGVSSDMPGGRSPHPAPAPGLGLHPHLVRHPPAAGRIAHGRRRVRAVASACSGSSGQWCLG